MSDINDHICKSIEFRLYEYGFVAIPGLGMLLLSEQGAKIDFIADKVIPPSRQIHFLYSKDLEDYILANTLSNIAKDSIAWSMEMLDNWVERLHTEVLDGQIIGLGTLGEFYLNEGLIEFRQSRDVLQSLSYGLAPVAAKPVKRVAEPLSAKDSDLHPAISDSRARRGFRLLPWAAAVLILLAVSYVLYDRTLGSGIEPAGESNPIFYQEDRLNKNPEDVQKKYESLIPEETNSEINGADSIADEEILGSEPASKENEKTSAMPTEDYELEEYPETDDLSETELKATDPDERYPDLIGEVQKCVIIVGAFSKDRYFNAMQDRVQSHGFEVYVDTYRGLRRVGAITSCDRHLLLENLQYCREEIETAAWILN